MEGLALGAGALSASFNLISDKVLAAKAKKHYQIMAVGQAKLNTISDHISVELKDNMISDGEFKLVLSEVEKYNQMKENIRSDIKTKIDEEIKKNLIKQGKEAAIKEFTDMFGPRNVKA